MKKILSFLSGAAIILAAGLAYAEDVTPGSGDTGDQMIRNEDLSHIHLDPDQATVNQMPSEAEGSAAGGMSTDQGSSTGTEMDQGRTSVDKGAVEPGVEGQGAGGAAKDSDTWQKDMKKGDSSVEKGSEGSTGKGAGEETPAKDPDTYRYRY